VDQESPNTDFLYDFLYLDKSRAQSWLAQLVADGVQLSSKYSSSSTDSSKLNATGGVPGFVKGGGSSMESVTETMERSFNTEWSIPLNLLDTLSEADYIRKDVDGAPLGAVVHIRGNATVIDISFMQTGWDAFSAMILAQEKTTHANKVAKALQKAELSNIGGVLKFMPPMPQLYLQTDEGDTIWSVLHDEHMIVDTSVLTLTHGANIKGDWHMLAVLDALPDMGQPASPPLSIGRPIADGLLPVMNALREGIGRPDYAYAVSPIAIFRAITPQRV
jgi:hypothetical protein